MDKNNPEANTPPPETDERIQANHPEETADSTEAELSRLESIELDITGSAAEDIDDTPPIVSAQEPETASTGESTPETEPNEKSNDSVASVVDTIASQANPAGPENENKIEPGSTLAGSLLQNKPRNKRPIWIASIAAFVLLVGGGIAAFALIPRDTPETPVASASPTPKPQKRLGIAATVVDGTVSYKTTGEWKILTTDTELKEGTSIRTSADSRTVLTFDDGSALRLDASTTVKLASLVADNIKIEQSEGTAYSRVVPSERKYAVVVEKSTYTALGTAFVTVNTEDEKGVQVIQNSVKVSGEKETVTEGKQYYSANTDAKLQKLITAIDLDKFGESDFVKWNLTEDEKVELFKNKLGILDTIKQRIADKLQSVADEAKKKSEEEAATSTGGITVSSKQTDKGTEISWTTAATVSAPKGFKIVYSTSSNTPTFNKDSAAYISDPAARSHTWGEAAGTYWIRVCAYAPDDPSGCLSYSNAIQVTATKKSGHKD